MERKLFVSDLAIKILKDELIFASPDDYAIDADGSEYCHGLIIDKDDMENIYIGEKGADTFTDVEDLIWVVSEERGADSWLELFASKREALRYAKDEWDKMTDYDRSKTVVEVRQYVNEYDYNPVWSSNNE